MFQTKVVHNTKTRFVSSTKVLKKSYRLRDEVEKTQNALLRFHLKNAYANATQCYVIRVVPYLLLHTLRVLFHLLNKIFV